MSTKYLGLPDIDTAPDVFETGDEPDPISRPNDIGLEEDDFVVRKHSELIDTTGLPARKKAERVFGRRSERYDRLQYGLPSHPGRRCRSSSSSSDDDVRKETPGARIRRLKMEVAQLERDMQETTTASPSGYQAGDPDGAIQSRTSTAGRLHNRTSLVDELAGLRARLGVIDVQDSQPLYQATSESRSLRQRLEQLSKPSEDLSETATAGTGNEGHRNVGRKGLSDIDDRLAVLELLIGQSDLGSAVPSPLLSTLNRHDHLLSLLTQPRHLDAISRRVKLLLVDLDRAATAARRQGASTTPLQASDKNVTLSQTDYNSLQSLFALLPRLDPLIPVITPLLARLQSLAGLHAAAGGIADGLIRLQNGDIGESAELQQLTSAVQSVQHGLDDATKQVTANLAGLESRMKDLEDRLQKLSK